MTIKTPHRYSLEGERCRVGHNKETITNIVSEVKSDLAASNILSEIAYLEF
jgi:hypothetical protein